MLLYLGVNLAFFANNNIFFLSKLITFAAYSPREIQNFFTQTSPRYKLWLFSIVSKAEIYDIEYPQGTCSHATFVVKDFSSVFLSKYSRLVYVIYNILSDFR